MPYQISVFSENKPGKIERITGILARENINIRAITISDAGDYGIVKLLLDKPDTACDLLQENGVAAALKEVVAVRVEDRVGGLHDIAQVLRKNDINVDDAYAFITQAKKEAVFVFQCADIKRAERILRDHGLILLTETELYLI
ncbi:MAG: ACT domain-containing protein [Spirochaetota bacterium]